MPDPTARVAADDGTGVFLPPKATSVPAPSRPSSVADWLLTFWKDQNRPLIVRLREFYQFNGKYWEHGNEDDLCRQLYAILDRCQYDKQVQGVSTPTAWDPDEPKLRKLLHALKNKAPSHTHLQENTWFDGRDDLVIPCRNGLVRVNTLERLEHTSDYFCTYVLASDFDPNASCPKTDEFIRHLANGDKESQRLLYEWMGYTVTGSKKYQKGLIVKGLSGCGKGVLGRLMNLILTDDNYAGFKVKDYKGNAFPKEPLIGKSLVMFSDNRADFAEQQDFLDLILEVIGNDPTSIRLPYARRSLHLQLPCRFMIFTNLMPTMADDSGAFVRRFVVIECKAKPDNEIPDYERVLFSELPGIINRMLQGLRSLENNGGFRQPEAHAWILEAMKRTSSIEKEFVTDMCEIGPTETHMDYRDAVYSDYLIYCSEAQAKPMSKTKFGEALIGMGGIELHRRGSRDSKEVWYLEGVKLKTSKLRLKAVTARGCNREVGTA